MLPLAVSDVAVDVAVESTDGLVTAPVVGGSIDIACRCRHR